MDKDGVLKAAVEAIAPLTCTQEEFDKIVDLLHNLYWPGYEDARKRVIVLDTRYKELNEDGDAVYKQGQDMTFERIHDAPR